MMRKFLVYVVVMLILGVGGLGVFRDFMGFMNFGSGSVWAEEGERTEEEGMSEKMPEIYIKAINPGYTVDGVGNVGEMIEIGRKTDFKDPISLENVVIGYTNSGGNYAVLVEFPEQAWMIGESLLLRLASAPEAGEANVVYTKTLAMNGGLSLERGEEVIDELCWTGKEGCYKAFKSSKPTILVRNLETGEFEHVGIEEYKGEAIGGVSQCKGLQFSEILSYYETAKTEQFIEIYNGGSEQVLLDGCKLKYKNKKYDLSGIVGAEGYFVYYPTGFSLTKNPTNVNTLEIVDTDGVVVDRLEYPNGQRKGTAYAMIGYNGTGEEIWKVTYAATPGEANNYQEFKTCEAGKVVNEATGNCVKVTTVATKVCPEGQYLNVLTGRCRKNPTATTAKTCKEGYYLNPDTGRCRKIVENTGAEYSVQAEEYEEESSFTALYIVLGVIGVGVGYVIYEFRHEIGKLWRKVCRRAR